MRSPGQKSEKFADQKELGIMMKGVFWKTTFGILGAIFTIIGGRKKILLATDQVVAGNVWRVFSTFSIL